MQNVKVVVDCMSEQVHSLSPCVVFVCVCMITHITVQHSMEESVGARVCKKYLAQLQVVVNVSGVHGMERPTCLDYVVEMYGTG